MLSTPVALILSPIVRTQSGNTALVWATTNAKPQIAKVLLEHKADPDLKGDVGLNVYAME